MNNTADTILINGKVITVDSNNTIAQALAIKGNRIMSIGHTNEILSLSDKNTKVIDLNEKTCVPGFIDSHLHTAVLGINMIGIDCRPSQAGSIAEIQKKLSRVAEQTPAGSWIRGWGYDDSKLIERRHPNRFDLDEVSKTHPIMITRACSHISTHNSLSLQRMEISESTPAIEGGMREKENGKLNGVLKENAHMEAMKYSIPSEEELITAIKEAQKLLLSQGITSVHDSGGFGESQMRAFLKIKNSGDLKIRIYTMIFSFVENLNFHESYLSTGLYTGFGDAHLRLGPIKLMIDGSSSGPTAATHEPYASNPNYSGILSMKPEDVNRHIAAAHKKGWQVTCHAVGDKAITIIIDAIEKAIKEFPRQNLRHRIEHCAMINPEILRRVKRLGIIPVPQPIFLYEFGDGYMKNYGRDRAFSMFSSKSFISEGIHAAGSSDCPITFSNPLLNMHLAVNRTTQTGMIINEEECIDIMEALKMFTIYGAEASFEENIKGSLETGKLADIAVINGDLLGIPKEAVKDLKVDMTFVNGELVYSSD